MHEEKEGIKCILSCESFINRSVPRHRVRSMRLVEAGFGLTASKDALHTVEEEMCVKLRCMPRGSLTGWLQCTLCVPCTVYYSPDVST